MSGLKESRSVDANSSPSVLNECSCDACRNQGSPEAEEDDGKRDDVLNFTSINDFIKDDPKTTGKHHWVNTLRAFVNVSGSMIKGIVEKKLFVRLPF